MQAEWEGASCGLCPHLPFNAGVSGTLGQNLIQYVSKVTTALILFVGAQSVIEGTMTVGELIAFNMIASQVVQPILRPVLIVAGFSAGAGVRRAFGGYPQRAAGASAPKPSDLATAARGAPSSFVT